jgi:hypothetical protein
MAKARNCGRMAQSLWDTGTATVRLVSAVWSMVTQGTSTAATGSTTKRMARAATFMLTLVRSMREPGSVTSRMGSAMSGGPMGPSTKGTLSRARSTGGGSWYWGTLKPAQLSSLCLRVTLWTTWLKGRGRLTFHNQIKNYHTRESGVIISVKGRVSWYGGPGKYMKGSSTTI